MSTFATNTSSGPRPSIAVLPHMEIPRRRKACEIDDAEDEPSRPIKRTKQSHGPEQASTSLQLLGVVLTSLQNYQRLAKMSLIGTGRKRVRGEGKAVGLRKRFNKSLRNIPAQPDNAGSAQFAFTFVPTPFALRQDVMEDIEVSLPAMDIDLIIQSPAVSPQLPQVPMSIDSPQTVGSTEISASISTPDIEMEVALEHVHALDAAATPFGDEDKVIADAPQVSVPDTKSFISRFLARAAAAATAITRQATPFKKTIQPKGAIRGVGKTSSRKIHAAATPYARTGRRQALTTAPRSNKSRRTATDSSVLEPLIPSDDHVAWAVEDAVQGVALEILEGVPAPVDEIDLEELLAETKPTSETQEIEVFYDALEGGEHEVTHTSRPPSPVLSSPQLLPATPAPHNCDDDACIACLLLTTDVPQAPNSPPSLCNTNSEDSSAYASEIDEYYIESAPYNVVADAAAWLPRDVPVLPGLEEEEAVVVVPVEETRKEEIDILPVADSCLGSLFAHLDKLSFEDSAHVLPTVSCADVLMPSGSDVWYDAMDDSVSPSLSFGDIQMTYDASYTDFMDGIIVDHTHYSAPPSSALPAYSPMADIDYALPSHSYTAIGNYDTTTLLGPPLEPHWTSSFFLPTSPRTAADPLGLGTDACLKSPMDLDITTTSYITTAAYNVFVPGLDYSVHPTPAQQPTCSTRLPGGDSEMAMLEDSPSADLMDFAISPVPDPAPVFPATTASTTASLNIYDIRDDNIYNIRYDIYYLCDDNIHD
ncbi:hypothetical protein VTO73DRAFT_5854 [Trametes versicolor]